eukprot:2510254-Prymnesium_polylepis.1
MERRGEGEGVWFGDEGSGSGPTLGRRARGQGQLWGEGRAVRANFGERSQKRHLRNGQGGAGARASLEEGEVEHDRADEHEDIEHAVKVADLTRVPARRPRAEVRGEAAALSPRAPPTRQ